MKVVNLASSTNSEGEKTLDINVYGVIAQGFADTVDAAVIAKTLLENRDAKAITVHINSIGGNAFDGIAIYNMLQNHGAPVTSIVEGMAASAASIIAMAGRTVIREGGMLLVHNPWTVAMGDAKELRRVAADLDKSRDSLIAIYKSKTGKSGQDLRAMLDAETLMTAEQAKRNGFADEIATDVEATVEAAGDQVIFNRVSFPSDRLPQGVVNMARKSPQAPLKSAIPKAQDEPSDPPGEVVEASPESTDSVPDPDPKPIVTPAPEAPPQIEARVVALPEAITRDIIAARAPDVLASLLAEGVAAERARLQGIDELGLKGCDDLVIAAKYGEKPMDARDLAVAALKAGKQAGLDLIEARRSESKEASGVQQTTPEKNGKEAAEKAAVKNMVEYARSRYGGKK